jgi:hypothetical protein
MSSIDIHRTIRKTRNRVQQIRKNPRQQLRQERLHRQMLLLTISSILIFITTTIPVNLREVVAAYEITYNHATDFTEIIFQTAILNVLLTVNYSVSICQTSLLLIKLVVC